MNFDEAFRIVIGHEGGYVNDPRDPGGETNFGISKRTYPKEDIKGMTLERAKHIYKRDYWDKCRCDELPEIIRYSLFDCAVNSGVPQAIQFLQRTVKTKDDGIIGPKTLAAARIQTDARLLGVFNGLRLHFMTNLRTWPTFGRGWARRVAEILRTSA